MPAILGPTASGKTALSIPLALRLDGEIISMDSRQVYRGMDIGTAKVGAADRARVSHHGIDVVAPDERYSAGRFARETRTRIREIRSRGRVPLLVGGTGFFLQALTDPIFREPRLDEGRRERLRQWLAGRPREELQRWVRVLDPEREDVASEGGPQRLSRTLEVALLTGRPLSEWHRTAPPDAQPTPVANVVLHLPREELDRRIDARAAMMFREGLLDEVRRLLEAGFTPGDPAMTGTGYREAAAVLDGRISMAEAVDRVQRVTRGYARRQLTWFRNRLSGPVLEVDAMQPLEAQVDQVTAWWRGTGPGRRG